MFWKNVARAAFKTLDVNQEGAVSKAEYPTIIICLRIMGACRNYFLREVPRLTSYLYLRYLQHPNPSVGLILTSWPNKQS